MDDQDTLGDMSSSAAGLAGDRRVEKLEITLITTALPWDNYNT